MLGVLMFGTTFTALAVDVDVCTATIEQLHGQGRFTMGGLSRFTMGGLEGADGDLSNADLPKEVIDQILNNQIKPDWLLSLLPTIASSEGFGSEEVAILVADDFPDFKRTFNSPEDLPSKWKTELNDYVDNFGGAMPAFPLDVPILTHGQIVFIEMVRQLEKLKEVYPDLPISLHRVDISELGEYRLARVRPAIVNKVNELKAQGIKRFVINMSFGLIPCVDNNTGFSYQNFLEHRAARRNEPLGLDGGQALIDNFTLDVDGSFFNPLGSPGEQIEKRMVLYQDFGMLEYLNNVLTLRDGVQNIDKAKGLMRKLMTSPKVGRDSNEPELRALRNLLQGYMLESAQPEGARYIVVGASGNYADLIVPDAPPGACQPARSHRGGRDIG